MDGVTERHEGSKRDEAERGVGRGMDRDRERSRYDRMTIHQCWQV